MIARRLALAPLLVAVAACAAPPPPEPVAAGDLGASYRQIGRSRQPILAGCGSDPLAASTAAAVSGWLDVLRHTDTCRLSTIRYYTSAENTGPLHMRLELLAGRGDACGSEAARLEARLASLEERLGRLKATAMPYCAVPATKADLERHVDELEARGQRLDDMIEQSFPEY